MLFRSKNKHKTFTRLNLKDARTKANNLRHIKAITRHHMVGMLSMHQTEKYPSTILMRDQKYDYPQ